MATKKNIFKELLVWLFIFAGFCIFSLLIYVIGANKTKLLSSIAPTYKTILFDSSGIYVGTKISIHGKNTGNVSQMLLLPNGKIQIHFTVSKKHLFIITKSSFIETKTAGAIGDRYINIITPDFSSGNLKLNSLIPYKASSSILSLLSKNDIATMLQDIISQVSKLLSQINNSSHKIFTKNNSKNISEILQSSKNILKKIESGEGSLGALISDPSLYNRLLLLLGKKPMNNYIDSLSKKSRSKKTK